MARPSLADSLRASLSKGVHVDASEKIMRGLQPVIDDPAPSPTPDTTPETAESFLSSQPAVLAKEISSPINTDQAIKQSSNQAIGQSNKQADNQTNNQTIKQTIKQTDKQSLHQLSRQSGNQPVKQAINQTVEQPTEQSAKQAIEQAIKQTLVSTSPQSDRQRWLPFNENQGRLLLFLYEKGGGLTNMDIVVAETGVAYGTARAGIDVLIREGYITYKARHNGHNFRGFEYAMNNHLCSLYAARIHGDQNEQSAGQTIRQSSNQTINQTMRQVIGQTGNQALAVVSSYKDLQSTTTENLETTDLLRDPELAYWKEKGVSNRKIHDWADEFQMPVDQVIQSLKYCRYEMVVLNQEEEKQIAKPDNWFYKIMQRSGVYPKPTNYKSLVEIRAEQMEQAAREAAEARERQIAAEQELAFQNILSNTTSDAYKELLSRVSDFAREMGGKALETAMREIFITG